MIVVMLEALRCLVGSLLLVGLSGSLVLVLEEEKCIRNFAFIEVARSVWTGLTSSMESPT